VTGRVSVEVSDRAYMDLRSYVQILNSSGVADQQDVFHVHFHVVPRARGDGQDIRRITHPQWRPRFDDLVSRLA
jgi:histidine triad (HIT) family protein